MSSESIMYVQFTPFVQGDALIKFFEALENDPQSILRGIAKWQESSFFSTEILYEGFGTNGSRNTNIMPTRRAMWCVKKRHFGGFLKRWTYSRRPLNFLCAHETSRTFILCTVSRGTILWTIQAKGLQLY